MQKKTEMGKKMTRKDRQALNERMSKFFERVAELVFGGVILSGILKEDVGLLWLILGGAVSIGMLLMVSYVTFLNSRK